MATAKQIDFSKVKDGGNFNKKRIPSGDYLATIIKIEDAKAKDDIFQYLVSIKINKRPSSVLPYYCKLQENQLWKLRNLLIAAGLSVPKKKIKVEPSRLLNKQIGVTIEDDEYDDKPQSTIAGVFPPAELGESEAEEDEDEAGDEEEDEDDLDIDGGSSDEDEEEEEEETEDEDPYAALDRNELKALLKKRDPEFQARKSQDDDALRALLREGDGDDDLDDEEEEPAPVKKAASKKTSSATKAKAKKRPINEVSDEELEELDIDDL